MDWLSAEGVVRLKNSSDAPYEPRTAASTISVFQSIDCHQFSTLPTARAWGKMRQIGPCEALRCIAAYGHSAREDVTLTATEAGFTIRPTSIGAFMPTAATQRRTANIPQTGVAARLAI